MSNPSLHLSSLLTAEASGISEYWRFVDTFSVFEAAALWCNAEPPAFHHSQPLGVRDFRAVKRMLIDAIEKGELAAEVTKDIFDDHSKTKVTRSNLAAWARSKKLFPGFLFDTVLPENDRWSGMDETGTIFNSPMPDDNPETLIPDLLPQQSALHVNESQINSPTVIVDVPESTASALEPEKKRRGRPREHDWDGMYAHALWIADIDGLPPTSAQLVKMLLQWFRDTYDKEPHQSQVHERIDPIYKILKERNWEPSCGAVPSKIASS